MDSTKQTDETEVAAGAEGHGFLECMLGRGTPRTPDRQRRLAARRSAGHPHLHITLVVK